MEFVFRYLVEAILVDSFHLPCIKGFTDKDKANEFYNDTIRGKLNHYKTEKITINGNLNNDVVKAVKLIDRDNGKHYATLIFRDLKKLI